MTRDELILFLEGQADKIMEHVDSVQIVVTFHDAAGKQVQTKAIDVGRGNFYARQGSVRELIQIWDAYALEHAWFVQGRDRKREQS